MIYGVTFANHEQKCAFNGSRLGREFSANVFQKLFSAGEWKQQTPVSGKKNTAPQALYDTWRDASEPATSPVASMIDEALDIFDVKPHGEDCEENEFARRMRRKRKRRIL